MNLPDREFAARVRTMQIIAFAMTFGVALASIILAVVRSQQPPAAADADALPVVSLVAVMLMASGLAGQFVLPPVMLGNAVRAIATRQAAGDALQDERRLLSIRQTAQIVAYALLEGPAFFGAIAYLIEGQPYTIAGTGFIVAIMLVRFPTAARVRAWVDEQLGRVVELREFGVLS